MLRCVFASSALEVCVYVAVARLSMECFDAVCSEVVQCKWLSKSLGCEEDTKFQKFSGSKTVQEYGCFGLINVKTSV